MKQTFFLLAIIAIFNLRASAQIKKGSIYLGGDVSVASQKRELSTPQPNYKNDYANFTISAGWFVNQNSLFGIYTSYGHLNTNNQYYPNINYRDMDAHFYQAGVFFRQYKKLAKDFYFFGELGTGYTGSNETAVDKPSNLTTTYKENGAELYLTPGVSYRIYKKLNLELSVPKIANLSYLNRKETYPTDVITENRFNANTSLSSSVLNSLALGFRFIL